MVRLVFRPYTHIRRTICTSVSLLASIRVSPDFTLLRHSSPSFGSDPYRSYSNLSQRSKSVDCAKQKNPICYFHSAYRFVTRTLAIEVDSLVRVSRRVEKSHLVNVMERPDTPHRSRPMNDSEPFKDVSAIMAHRETNANLCQGNDLQQGWEIPTGKTAAPADIIGAPNIH